MVGTIAVGILLVMGATAYASDPIGPNGEEAIIIESSEKMSIIRLESGPNIGRFIWSTKEGGGGMEPTAKEARKAVRASLKAARKNKKKGNE